MENRQERTFSWVQPTVDQNVILAPRKSPVDELVAWS